MTFVSQQARGDPAAQRHLCASRGSGVKIQAGVQRSAEGAVCTRDPWLTYTFTRGGRSPVSEQCAFCSKLRRTRNCLIPSPSRRSKSSCLQPAARTLSRTDSPGRQSPRSFPAQGAPAERPPCRKHRSRRRLGNGSLAIPVGPDAEEAGSEPRG